MRLYCLCILLFYILIINIINMHHSINDDILLFTLNKSYIICGIMYSNIESLLNGEWGGGGAAQSA